MRMRSEAHAKLANQQLDRVATLPHLLAQHDPARQHGQLQHHLADTPVTMSSISSQTRQAIPLLVLEGRACVLVQHI